MDPVDKAPDRNSRVDPGCFGKAAGLQSEDNHYPRQLSKDCGYSRSSDCLSGLDVTPWPRRLSEKRVISPRWTNDERDRSLTRSKRGEFNHEYQTCPEPTLKTYEDWSGTLRSPSPPRSPRSPSSSSRGLPQAFDDDNRQLTWDVMSDAIDRSFNECKNRSEKDATTKSTTRRRTSEPRLQTDITITMYESAARVAGRPPPRIARPPPRIGSGIWADGAPAGFTSARRDEVTDIVAQARRHAAYTTPPRSRRPAWKKVSARERPCLVTSASRLGLCAASRPNLRTHRARCRIQSL